MRKKAILTLLVSAAAICMSGCGRDKSTAAPYEANVLGIVKYEGENYTHTGPTTASISSDELVSRKNFSGSKTTLLWGLITIKDY